MLNIHSTYVSEILFKIIYLKNLKFLHVLKTCIPSMESEIIALSSQAKYFPLSKYLCCPGIKFRQKVNAI